MSSSDTETARTAQGSGNLGNVIPSLAAEIARLDPGSAAALRHDPLSGAGAAAFWRLLTRYSADGDEQRWAAMIQAVAILTPKGRRKDNASAHQQELSMGKALFQAGVSELRLARLLAAPSDQRSDLVVRICRRLARTDFKRFNLLGLGQFVLAGDNTPAARRACRRIAREYYRADLEATLNPGAKETHTDA